LLKASDFFLKVDCQHIYILIRRLALFLALGLEKLQLRVLSLQLRLLFQDQGAITFKLFSDLMHLLQQCLIHCCLIHCCLIHCCFINLPLCLAPGYANT